jgi:hypothetical protein
MGGGISIVAANNALISRITGARTVTQQAIEKIILKLLYRGDSGGPTRRFPQQQQQQQIVNV